MKESKRKWDRRLLGTWKSDKRRTFKHYRPRRGCSPQALARLKSLFGKLIVHWGAGTYHTILDGRKTTGTYKIVAQDWNSVVIRSFNEFIGEFDLTQIIFDGEYYYITTIWAGHIVEHFRKVKSDPKGKSKKPKG